MKKLFITAALSLWLSGCQAPELSQSWVCTEVYFGLSKPDGSAISTEEWTRFVDQVVTPRFPDGLTVQEGRGQWRGADGRVVHEPSRILVLLHRPDEAADARIDEIRAQYRQQFSQEAVMKVTSPAAVRF